VLQTIYDLAQRQSRMKNRQYHLFSQ
jgi:hypothetical protein